MVLSDMERGLFELPAIYGGRGIIKPSKISDRENRNSQILTQEESRLIKNQHLISDVNKDKLKEIKNGIKCEKSRQYQDSLTKIKQILRMIDLNLHCWCRLENLQLTTG